MFGKHNFIIQSRTLHKACMDYWSYPKWCGVYHCKEAHVYKQTQHISGYIYNTTDWELATLRIVVLNSCTITTPQASFSVTIHTTATKTLKLHPHSTIFQSTKKLDWWQRNGVWNGNNEMDYDFNRQLKKRWLMLFFLFYIKYFNNSGQYRWANNYFHVTMTDNR